MTNAVSEYPSSFAISIFSFFIGSNLIMGDNKMAKMIIEENEEFTSYEEVEDENDEEIINK